MIHFKKIILLFLVSLFISTGLILSNKNADAQTTGCTTDPKWTYDNVEDRPTSVVYHLHLKNNCANTKNFNLRVTQLPTSPHNISGWTWRFGNGEENTTYVKSVSGGGNAAVALVVNRPTNVTVPEGNYTPITVRAALAADTTINDTINLVYIVQNTITPVPTTSPTCVRQRPVLEVTPTALTGAAAEEKEFTVKITDGDSPECNPALVSISAGISDQTWDAVLNDTFLTLGPGDVKTTKLFVTPPLNAADGPVTVTVNIQRPNGALISQNVVYNVDNPEPTVTPVPSISPIPTADPTPSPEQAKYTDISLKVGIDGIGTTKKISIGGNKNPQHPNRQLTAKFYSATNSSYYPSWTWTFTYNPTSQKFEALLNSPDSGIQSGIYNVYVEGPQVLRGRLPGSVTITKGQLNTIPTALDLVTGDINKVDRSNNNIDLNDYNILISCSIYSQDRTACDLDPNYERYSDLNDDGIIDEDDFTLWLKEVANQGGAELPE
jgi:hypothetical protein